MASADTELNGLKVLVIDDSEHVRSFLTDVLTDAGYLVTTAQNGNEGLEEFGKARPDCVLLDIIMPDLDGLEVLKRIREVSQELPVLIMTGEDPGWARRSCESFGANGFVSKAFHADTVVDAVENAILDSET